MRKLNLVRQAVLFADFVDAKGHDVVVGENQVGF